MGRHRSSVVEHTLGKGEVMGSSPIGGLFPGRWVAASGVFWILMRKAVFRIGAKI